MGPVRQSLLPPDSEFFLGDSSPQYCRISERVEATYYAATIFWVLLWLLARLERTRGFFPPSLNAKAKSLCSELGFLVIFMCQG